MTIEIKFAKDRKTREQVYHFRYRIHTMETVKDGHDVDHLRQWIKDDLDETAEILYALMDNEIVGTIRLNRYQDLKDFDQIEELYHVKPLTNHIDSKLISISSSLIMDPRLRNHTLASLLMVSLFQHGLDQGFLVDYTICKSDLKTVFNRLGYRTYQKLSKNDQYIAQILCYRDYNHLLTMMSPYAMSLNHEIDDHGATANIVSSVYKNFDYDPNIVISDFSTFWAEVADIYARHVYRRASIFDDLNNSEIENIVKHSSILKFSKGEWLKLPDEFKNGIGVVAKGKLGEGIDKTDYIHWNELFLEGDTFGKVSPHHSTGNENAELIALEDCEIIYIPFNILEILKKEDPILATRVTMNMIALMQQRLTESEEIVLLDDEIDDISIFL